jgi:hypothetical protein
MDILTPEQIARIYAVTDALDLNRNFVVVPLATKVGGLEMILPDGKLLVRGPPAGAFEAWFAGLRERLMGLEIARVRRAAY